MNTSSNTSISVVYAHISGCLVEYPVCFPYHLESVERAKFLLSCIISVNSRLVERQKCFCRVDDGHVLFD